MRHRVQKYDTSMRFLGWKKRKNTEGRVVTGGG